MILRAALASVVAAALGVAAIGHATEGFRVVTAEGARRLDVAAHPRAVPDALLEDKDGRRFRLGDYQGRPVLVEFFYTRCASICTRLTGAFQVLDRALPAGTLFDPVLIGISFDPENDTPSALRDYGRAYGADGRSWRFARPVDGPGLAALLKAFGVVVVPDGEGGFDHNAAIHLIDRKGRFARVYDIEDTSVVLTDLGAD